MKLIRSVWAHNFHQEITAFNQFLHRFPIISFDTEFPGFIRDTPRDALEDERYGDVRFNVDTLKLIQLGFTLSDPHGNIAGTWEFNFAGFDEKSDPHVAASISLLKKNGLDFEKIGNLGISVDDFVARFLGVLKIHRRLHDVWWVCFHGLYDMAYVLRLLTRKPMPESVVMFAKALGAVFGGNVYDVKYMARYCSGLFGGEIGLARMAKILDVERSGEAHQAGSDSLLTAGVFAKMNTMFRTVAGMCQGWLYGISPKIVRPPPLVICVPASRPPAHGFWQPLQAPMAVAPQEMHYHMIHRPRFHFAAPRVYCAPIIHSAIPSAHVHIR